MAFLIVTGTSTDVGKTVTTAAVAAAVRAAGRTVAVVKPAQTGVVGDDPGDAAEVSRLSGALAVEGVRYPEPLAPETAAARAGIPGLTLDDVRATIVRAGGPDLLLVEGAGGVLVRLGPELTVLDVATALDAPVLVVAASGLGTLNHTELTVEAIRARGASVSGVVIGSWPARPDLASVTNRDDLPRLTGVPVVGSVPEGAGSLPEVEFVAAAPGWFERGWIAGLTRGGAARIRG